MFVLWEKRPLCDLGCEAPARSRRLLGAHGSSSIAGPFASATWVHSPLRVYASNYCPAAGKLYTKESQEFKVLFLEGFRGRGHHLCSPVLKTKALTSNDICEKQYCILEVSLEISHYLQVFAWEEGLSLMCAVKPQAQATSHVP